ncbi:MAG: hypothetical protein PVJ05_11185 [Candidatus Thorarchaeota archaeon]|jgi:hypothetical protein
MIGLKFSGIRKDQLNEWMAKLPEAWHKARGRLSWGTGFEFRSKVDREMEHQDLVITEWRWTNPMGPGMKLMILFLFNTDENTCEVYFSAVEGQAKYESKMAIALKSAFNKLFPFR